MPVCPGLLQGSSAGVVSDVDLDAWGGKQLFHYLCIFLLSSLAEGAFAPAFILLLGIPTPQYVRDVESPEYFIERFLCVVISLFGGFVIPMNGLNVVFRYTVAVVVAHA